MLSFTIKSTIYRPMVGVFLCLLTAVLLYQSAATGEAAPAIYYVSATSGSPTGTGTSGDPFATIQQCADVAAAGDSCLIAGGVYRETVIPASSGTITAPITFKAAEGETVTIRGTEAITGWTPHSGNIYVADMVGDFFSAAEGMGSSNPYDATVHNQADQIFVDDEMMLSARWPNDTTMDVSLPVKAVTETYIDKDERSAANNNWTTGIMQDDALIGVTESIYEGADIYFQTDSTGAWAWLLSGYVTDVDSSNGRFTFKTRSNVGEGDFPPASQRYDDNSRYYLYNKLALLDSPGEWYHDKANDLLYLWAPTGVDPDQVTVEAKAREFAFNLSDRNYITIENIDLFAATITTDLGAGGDQIGYTADGGVRYPWRNAAYNRTDPATYNHAASTGVVLDGLTVTYPTHFTDVSGHAANQWGQSSGIVLSGYYHTLRNSVIRYSAGNGVSLLGVEHRVYDNEIYDTNYMVINSGAIGTGKTRNGSQDHEIAYNTIARSGRHGIAPGNMFRTDVTDGSTWKGRIHHNDISAFGMQNADVGGFYTGGSTDGFVRIDHNWVHDAYPNVDGTADAGNYTASGVYPDYGSQLIIDHNVIWNMEWGIHVQNQEGGQDADYLIYNNTVRVNRFKDSIVYGPFGVVKNAGGSQHEGTVIRNNIFWNADNAPGYTPSDITTDLGIGRIYSDNLEWDNLVGSPTDPDFLNADGTTGLDFQLGVGSTAEDNGVTFPGYTYDVIFDHKTETNVTIPAFNEIVGSAVDQGAYERGGEAWTAGRRIESCAAPSAVSDLTLTPGAADLQVNWTATDADEYEIWWAENDAYFSPASQCTTVGNCATTAVGPHTITGAGVGNYTVLIVSTEMCGLNRVSSVPSVRHGVFNFEITPGD